MYVLDTLSFGNTIYVFDENINEAQFTISVSRPFRNDIEVEIQYIDFTATGNLCIQLHACVCLMCMQL